MPGPVKLVDGSEITYEDAIDSERNVVAHHLQWSEIIQQYRDAYDNREALEKLTAFHIGIDVDRVQTGPASDWRRGSFNLAIPMDVFDERVEAKVSRVLLRCPIATKCGEKQCPGTMLEKLRGETASYVWMQRQCPGVRIPHLYGFGFPNGTHVRLLQSYAFSYNN